MTGLPIPWTTATSTGSVHRRARLAARSRCGPSRLIPFCAYNSVGCRDQIRQQLSGVTVPNVVPSAAELALLLLTTRYGSKIVATNTGSCAERDRTGARIARPRATRGQGLLRSRLPEPHRVVDPR
jgi:hypothetical protein